MQHSNGFSLIETIVAVAIASLSVAALLQAISTTSRSSSEAIANHHETSIMGTLTRYVTQDSDSLRSDEILLQKYGIDHTEIREALEPYSYTILPLGKEEIDPLMLTGVSGSATAPHTLTLQKFLISGSGKKRSFFRISTGDL